MGALESKSTHPLATALVNHASGCITDAVEKSFPEAFNIEVIEGVGIRGVVNNKSVLIGNKNVLEEETDHAVLIESY